jgi:hypothetical protein
MYDNIGKLKLIGDLYILQPQSDDFLSNTISIVRRDGLFAYRKYVDGDIIDYKYNVADDTLHIIKHENGCEITIKYEVAAHHIEEIYVTVSNQMRRYPDYGKRHIRIGEIRLLYYSNMGYPEVKEYHIIKDNTDDIFQQYNEFITYLTNYKFDNS